MDDDGTDRTLAPTANGGDATDGGFPDEKKQEALKSTAQEEGAAKAANEDIDHLRREIDGLLSDRSKLERQLDDALRSLDRAEGENRSLAAQAFNLEGQIRQTQEDLAAAASAADDAEAEANRLKAALADLEAAKARAEADLEAKLGALRTEVRRLEEELLLSEERSRAVSAENGAAAVREAELEATIMALNTAQLEAQPKVDRDLPPEININGNGKKEASVPSAAGAFDISWGSVAAGCVLGVAVTAAFYINRGTQR